MGRTFAAWPSGQTVSRATVHDASAALDVAERFQDLLEKPPPGSPYDFVQLFPAKSWRDRRRSRRRFKLLKAVDPRLAYVLLPGERVNFVTFGSTLTRAENFFTDWAAYYLNLRALAFTDRRVILIQINSRHRPLEAVAHIPYSAIAQVANAWGARCRLVLRDGSRLDLIYTPRADRKLLRERLGPLIQAIGPGPGGTAATGMENLCPRCFTPVKGFPRKCPACAGRLKRPFVSALLSTLFPGLGHWRLGCRGFASFELAVGLALWIGLVVLPLTRAMIREVVLPGREHWIVVGAGLGIVHLLDALMTLHYGRKGLRPAGSA